jgi:hypothetical protein
MPPLQENCQQVIHMLWNEEECGHGKLDGRGQKLRRVSRRGFRAAGLKITGKMAAFGLMKGSSTCEKDGLGGGPVSLWPLWVRGGLKKAGF